MSSQFDKHVSRLQQNINDQFGETVTLHPMRATDYGISKHPDRDDQECVATVAHSPRSHAIMISSGGRDTPATVNGCAAEILISAAEFRKLEWRPARDDEVSMQTAHGIDRHRINEANPLKNGELQILTSIRKRSQI